MSVTLGIKLFTRYPRERTYAEMDVRPAAARRVPNGQEPTDQKWAPAPGHTEDSRVMAGWIYHSWCYPAGYAYAVELNGLTDADDVVYDRYAAGGAKVLTQEVLGRILGMAKSNVCRATKRLAARKMLSVDDDGRVSPTVKPELSAAEREALLSTDDDQLGEAPNTIPIKFRHRLAALLEQYEGYVHTAALEGREVIETDYLEPVLKACEEYNNEHKKLRTDRDSVIERVCTALSSLLVRPIDSPAPSSSSQSTRTRTASQSQPSSHDDDDSVSINELYRAGLGDPALAKLPARMDRIPAWLMAVAEEHGIHADADAIDRLIAACRAAAPDIRAAEIAGGLRMKVAQALKKNNPIGFLITALPNLFKSGGLARIREQLKQEEAEAARLAAGRAARQGAWETEQEIVARVEATWEALSDSEKQARIKEAKKALQADRGMPGTIYRRCTPAQQTDQAIVECRRAIRDELEAEDSQGAS